VALVRPNVKMLSRMRGWSYMLRSTIEFSIQEAHGDFSGAQFCFVFLIEMYLLCSIALGSSVQ